MSSTTIVRCRRTLRPGLTEEMIPLLGLGEGDQRRSGLTLLTILNARVVIPSDSRKCGRKAATGLTRINNWQYQPDKVGEHSEYRGASLIRT